MGHPGYHEPFPGGYEANPLALADSASLTRLAQ